MKMKTMLFLTVASILVWTACSNEIDDSSTSGGNASLTLVMATEGTQTKAATGTETPATEAEALVSSVHVAVFDVTDIAVGDTANAKRVATFDNGIYESNKRETTVQITGLPAGSSQVKARKYLFYVIANSGVNFSAETKLDTYGKYKSYVVVTDPSKLIKVGQKTVDLYWKNEAELNMPSIAITLIQLTARVDFLGVVEQKDAQTKSGVLATNEKVEYEYVTEAWEQADIFAWYSYLEKKGYIRIEYSPSIGETICGLYFKDGTSQKRLVRYVKKTTSTTTNTNFTFTPTSIAFYNKMGANGNSLIAIYDTSKFENNVTKKVITPSLTVAKNTPLFYSYETNGTIQLAITGTWSGGGSSGSSTTEEYGYVIQKMKKPGFVDQTISATEDEFVTIRETKATKSINEVTYLLTLPTLLKGNRYEIRGTASPSANPVIEWEIKKWDSHTVIIPPFQ